MIFDALYESARRGELVLVAGGIAHVHLRRDGQLTIREIISTRPGAGSEMLAILRSWPGAVCIVAKCPAALAANGFWAHMGFVRIRGETTHTGRELNVWRLELIND